MTSIIVLGNINQYTFANSIVVANAKAKKIFSSSLISINIFHSIDSEKYLSKETKWKDHLQLNGIDLGLITTRTVEIAPTKESIEKFVGHIETVLGNLNEKSEVIVDLSNGTTLQKNLLSIVGYILDLQHQYFIDIIKLSEQTKDRGFLPIDILLTSYTSSPDSTYLDNLAYLNLSEMIRYKRIINDRTNRYVEIEPIHSDSKFFKDNLIRSIQIKMQADRSKDDALYRIAASSISTSLEDLISVLLYKIVENSNSGDFMGKTLGQKLQLIHTTVEAKAPSTFDLVFFRKFNDFILYLRNSTTHKGKLLTSIERFKAELSVNMSFPFVEFYTDIIYPLLADKEPIHKPKKVKRLPLTNTKVDELMYYGLDGDDTGAILEDLFLSTSEEQKFKLLSKSVSKAIAEISRAIRVSSEKNAIVFEAGDDLLFKGYFGEEDLKAFQKIYYDNTGGLTCSIGFGRSFREVYLALKLAKTNPGKNSIAGVEFD